MVQNKNSYNPMLNGNALEYRKLAQRNAKICKKYLMVNQYILTIPTLNPIRVRGLQDLDGEERPFRTLLSQT